MSLGSIIRSKREKLGLTLDEVSRRSGFSKPYISTVETGKVKNPPSDNFLVRLEKVLKFEKGSLQHIAHLERVPADVRQNYENIDAQNRRYRQIIKDLMVSEGGKLGDMISAEELESDCGSEQPQPGRLVPIINKVSAGYPADFDDMGYPVGFAQDYVRCPDIHDANAFGVRVVGDSMEPRFRQGDIVVFSPVENVSGGDDCFVRFHDPHESTFKRVFFEQDDKVRLQPRNEKYAPLIVDGKRINGIYKAIMRFEIL